MAAMALQSCVSLKLPFQFAFCSPNLHSLLWWLITPDVLQNVVAHVWFVCWSVAKFQGNWTQPWQCGPRLGHGTQASTQSRRHSVFSLRQLANRHLVRREMQRYEWLSKDFLTFFRKFSAVNFCWKSGFDLLHYPSSLMYWFWDWMLICGCLLLFWHFFPNFLLWILVWKVGLIYYTTHLH